MKRHEALIPLSHDHQNALARALRLRKASELDDPDARRAGAEAFVDFAQERIEPHFAEEEAVLARALEHADSPAVRAGAQQLHAEHARLRERFAAVRSAVDAAAEVPAELLHETGAALTAHIRFEERELFELLQRELGDELHEVVGSDG